jgi:hypothetical protein
MVEMVEMIDGDLEVKCLRPRWVRLGPGHSLPRQTTPNLGYNEALQYRTTQRLFILKMLYNIAESLA